MLHPPVLILCSSRTRSSLVARVFAEHGLWYSHGKTVGVGYPSYEDVAIKNVLRTALKRSGVGKDWVCKQFPQFDIRDELAKIVPQDTPWLCKVSAEYFPLFQASFPGFPVVCVYRDLQGAVDSIIRKRGGDPLEARKIIGWRFEYMNELLVTANAWPVNTDYLIKGDFYEMRQALEASGVIPDYDAMVRAIDLDLAKGFNRPRR